MTPRPLPEHTPGVVIAVPLNRLMEYYWLNKLEAAATQTNPGMTFPVIVTRPPVPAGVAGEINQINNSVMTKPAGILKVEAE